MIQHLQPGDTITSEFINTLYSHAFALAQKHGVPMDEPRVYQPNEPYMFHWLMDIIQPLDSILKINNRPGIAVTMETSVQEGLREIVDAINLLESL